MRLLDRRLQESKNKITELCESESDLKDTLLRTTDRLNKAEKEVAVLSEGGASGQRERDRLEDLRVRLQKQVSVCERERESVGVCAFFCV